jgi:hypothetical protein
MIIKCMLLSTLLLVLLSLVVSEAGEFVPGTVVGKVVALHPNNIQAAIRDPANSFWLLKFYAPWCVA